MSASVCSKGTESVAASQLTNSLFPSLSNFKYVPSANSQNEPGSNLGETGAPNFVIWGTNVSLDSCKRQFVDFLKDARFTVNNADMDEARLDWHQSEESRPLYLAKLEEIVHVQNEPYLTLNCSHLKEFNPLLYQQLVNYPSEVVQIFDMGANEVFQELYPEHDNIAISVRPFNIDQTYTIRGLGPADVNRLITISGMITRCSAIIPEMIRAFFKCTVCFVTREVPVESGHIQEPHICTACNSKFAFNLIHNRCKYIDRQLVKLQESPDDMPAGQTPHTVSLVATDDLVDKINAGDRVSVTGVYRANPVRVMMRQRRVQTPFRTTIDVIHYRRMKSGRLHDESSDLRLNPDRVYILKALSKDENIYEKLAKSLCPSIFGHIDVKKGILLQLFGGTRKQAPGSYSDPKLRHFRSEINILLCGDPGTSKSQLLQCVYKLVPRGNYTSGKGSSAVGLTAYITRDIDTKQLVLQTGALVMCDGGICCIDEFDKMSDATRSVLHEVMEQQTLSIAKAGIVCQLNARTSVLAAANPIKSEWDKNKTTLENVRLPDTLLSRFDLIFLILDPNQISYDETLARHLISLYWRGEAAQDDEVIPIDVLKDYIAYARSNIQPKLSDVAKTMLVNKYIDLREKVRNIKGHIKAYPRNLESLIRLAEAHAKLRFSPLVEAHDVDEAIRLVYEALKHYSIDPADGKMARN